MNNLQQVALGAQAMTDNQMLLAQHEGSPWLIIGGFLLLAATIWAYSYASKNLKNK